MSIIREKLEVIYPRLRDAIRSGVVLNQETHKIELCIKEQNISDYLMVYLCFRRISSRKSCMIASAEKRGIKVKIDANISTKNIFSVLINHRYTTASSLLYF